VQFSCGMPGSSPALLVAWAEMARTGCPSHPPTPPPHTHARVRAPPRRPAACTANVSVQLQAYPSADVVAMPAVAFASVCAATDTARFILNITAVGGGPAINASLLAAASAACSPLGAAAGTAGARWALFACSRLGAEGDAVAKFTLRSPDGEPPGQLAARLLT
jgi:hypothetical protein